MIQHELLDDIASGLIHVGLFFIVVSISAAYSTMAFARMWQSSNHVGELAVAIFCILLLTAGFGLGLIGNMMRARVQSS